MKGASIDNATIVVVAIIIAVAMLLMLVFMRSARSRHRRSKVDPVMPSRNRLASLKTAQKRAERVEPEVAAEFGINFDYQYDPTQSPDHAQAMLRHTTTQLSVAIVTPSTP